jgi:hypothetical protein
VILRVALEPPQPGQVIHYSYLWWNEARRGRIEGAKTRPCGVVLTRTAADGSTVVYVLPVTHTPPSEPEVGIEIPPATKRRLGLDAERSWVITTELNRFIWPGPDLRALPTGEYSFGYVPAKLMRAMLDQVRAHVAAARLRSVDRGP